MDLNYIIERLEERELPPGFERDLVIIGLEIYIVQENLVIDIKKKPHPIKLVKADIKQDGFLFVKDHRARVFIEKDHILAIELLRPTGAKKLKFSPKDDGRDNNIPSEGLLKDQLSSDECYVIVSYEYRKVYLWKGKNSNVRSRFIGAKRSQDIRGQVGMHFAVVPLDEGEEDPDFLKLIGRRTGGGITPHPYVSTPPKPPDDFAMAPQVPIRAPLKEKDPEGEVNCQYCGRKLTEEESLTHSCKEKPNKT